MRHLNTLFYSRRNDLAFAFSTCINSMGLSSCWVGAFDEIAVAKCINCLSSRVRPVALLVIGYGDSVAVSIARRRQRAHSSSPTIQIEEI